MRNEIYGVSHASFFENRSTVEHRSSILLSAGNSPEIDDATFSDSAFESDVRFNFMWLESYSMGDFRLPLSCAMFFANMAQWEPGDPPTDIHGDLRPMVDDSHDYVGADVL